MIDVRGDVLRPPHGRAKSNIKSEMRSFKSNENIHKKEGGSYYVVSANKANTFVTNDNFFWTDQKNQPYLQFFWIYILNHHKIPVPIGLDAKVFLIQYWI